MPSLSKTSPEAILVAQGTSRAESAFRAFPTHRVSQRLTTAEQLAEAERLNMRDRRPSQAPIARVEHIASGSPGHREHVVVFYFTDGTSQYFAPHAR